MDDEKSDEQVNLKITKIKFILDRGNKEYICNFIFPTGVFEANIDDITKLVVDEVNSLLIEED